MCQIRLEAQQNNFGNESPRHDPRRTSQFSMNSPYAPQHSQLFQPQPQPQSHPLPMRYFLLNQ